MECFCTPLVFGTGLKYLPSKRVSKQVSYLLSYELPVLESAQYGGIYKGLDEDVFLSGQPRDRLHALLHGLDGVLLT